MIPEGKLSNRILEPSDNISMVASLYKPTSESLLFSAEPSRPEKVTDQNVGRGYAVQILFW